MQVLRGLTSVESDTDSVLQAVQARLDVLERQLQLGAASVESALRQRGWSPGRHSSVDHLLLPDPPEPGSIAAFYDDFRQYHFRRLLQEAAELRTLTPRILNRLEDRWGERTVEHAFARLRDYGLLARTGRTWRATFPHTHTFGDTLEWFVAQVLAREFSAPAVWDMRIRDIPQGGDFDVLVVLHHRLGYIECKGSPPYNVSADALAQFLDRTRRLASDFSILVIDTTLKIDRNIIDNLHVLTGPGPVFSHLTPGVYEVSGARPFFVATSQRSLVANLRLCLRRLHGASAGSGKRVIVADVGTR